MKNNTVANPKGNNCKMCLFPAGRFIFSVLIYNEILKKNVIIPIKITFKIISSKPDHGFPCTKDRNNPLIRNTIATGRGKRQLIFLKLLTIISSENICNKFFIQRK
jgi:hypothetical protein